MAEATPRRGSTIAEKIALFRSAGTSASPHRPERHEAFWWQKPSPSRSDADPRDPARPSATSQPPPRTPAHGPPTSPGPRARSQQIDSDAGYRSVDQTHGHPSASRAAGAAPPAGPSGATAAALQRLAQEHPSLYSAVMSLERSPDGRLSEAALQLVNQALARSETGGTASASRTAPSAVAAAAPSVGHTTTTIVPLSPHATGQSQRLQQPQQQQQRRTMQEEVQARAQAALAAAAAAVNEGAVAGPSGRLGGQAEESMDLLLARYRRGGGRSAGGAPQAAAGTAGAESSASMRTSASAVGSSSAASTGAVPKRQQQPQQPAEQGPASRRGGGAFAAAAAAVTAASGLGSAAAAAAASRRAAPEQPPKPVAAPSAGSEPRGSTGGPLPQSARPPEPPAAEAAAVATAEPPASRKKPTAEKLQKILKLAQMANRLGGSQSAQSAGSGAATEPASRDSDGGAPDAAVVPAAAGGATAPSPAQPDLRRTGHASVGSSVGELVSEASLSAVEAQNAAATAAALAAASGTSSARGSGSSVASLAPDGRRDAEPAGAAGAAAAPASSQSAAVTEAAAEAARGTGPSATPPRSVGDAATGPAEESPPPSPPDAASGGSFAFPVTAGTAVDSAAMLMRGGGAARRVQFSLNEPQVRLYSQGTAGTATGAAAPEQAGTAPSTATAAAGAGASPGAEPGTAAGRMQPVFLLPSPVSPNDPNAPRPTHIFIPTNCALPPALVAVPGHEPVPPGSLKPPSRHRRSRSSSSGSPPKNRQGSPSTSPPRGGAAQGAAAAADGGGEAAGGTGAAAAASAAGKQRPPEDKVLDSDSSDSDLGSPSRRRVPDDMALEMKAAEQAAAQVEREASVHTPNRLTRLLDQVASFRRTEGERLLREGERLKMVEELKIMKIDQLAVLLGPNSELLKEISRFRDLYTGNLELVKASADEHTRAVLDALQRTSDTAQAVKDAVVESALQQQDEVLKMVDRIAPPAPPPPPPRSPLLSLPPQTLYGGAPAASDLMNPTWWTRLVDPANRASLSGCVAAATAAGDAAAQDAMQGDVAAAAAAAASAALAEEALRPVAAAGDFLAHQVAGLASAIRGSLDYPTGGGAEDLSVSAITRAARQVSMTLDMAVREYIDRTTKTTMLPADPGIMMAAAAVPGPALLPGLTPSLAGAALAPPRVAGMGMPSRLVASSPSAGPHEPWVVQPVAVPPVALPDGRVLQQPVTATAVLPTPPSPAVLYTLQPGTGGGACAQPTAVVTLQGAPAVAAGPELVAVQGQLPSGGFSGTGLLNLPMCAPVVAPGGHPVCVTSAAPLAGGGSALAPPSSSGPQPGDGLPCRMDLQVVRVLPPLHHPPPPAATPPQQLPPAIYEEQLQRWQQAQHYTGPQYQEDTGGVYSFPPSDADPRRVGTEPGVHEPREGSVVYGGSLPHPAVAAVRGEDFFPGVRETASGAEAFAAAVAGRFLTTSPPSSPSRTASIASPPRSTTSAARGSASHTRRSRVPASDRPRRRRSSSSSSSSSSDSSMAGPRRTPGRRRGGGTMEVELNRSARAVTRAESDRGSERHRAAAAPSKAGHTRGDENSASEDGQGRPLGGTLYKQGHSNQPTERNAAAAAASTESQARSLAGSASGRGRRPGSDKSSRVAEGEAASRTSAGRANGGSESGSSGGGSASCGRAASVAWSEASLAAGVAEIKHAPPHAMRFMQQQLQLQAPADSNSSTTGRAAAAPPASQASASQLQPQVPQPAPPQPLSQGPQEGPGYATYATSTQPQPQVQSMHMPPEKPVAGPATAGVLTTVVVGQVQQPFPQMSGASPLTRGAGPGDPYLDKQHGSGAVAMAAAFPESLTRRHIARSLFSPSQMTLSNAAPSHQRPQPQVLPHPEQTSAMPAWGPQTSSSGGVVPYSGGISQPQAAPLPGHVPMATQSAGFASPAGPATPGYVAAGYVPSGGFSATTGQGGSTTAQGQAASAASAAAAVASSSSSSPWASAARAIAHAPSSSTAQPVSPYTHFMHAAQVGSYGQPQANHHGQQPLHAAPTQGFPSRDLSQQQAWQQQQQPPPHLDQHLYPRIQQGLPHGQQQGYGQPLAAWPAATGDSGQASTGTPAQQPAAMFFSPPGRSRPQLPHPSPAASLGPRHLPGSAGVRESLVSRQQQAMPVQQFVPSEQLPQQPALTAPPQHPHQTGPLPKAVSGPAVALPAFPAMPAPAGQSEEVQHAYQATLAQFQAVYQGSGKG